ncbi:MAG: undecaprenyl-diphosphate phosphatase, partial [Thermoproteota archaeon]
MLNIGYQLLITCFVVSNLLISSVFQHNILEVFFLSIVQGLTEWFPISSSGHLVFFQELLNIKVSVAFDIVLHAGSLIGVVFFTRKDLHSLFKTLFKLNFSSSEGKILKYLVLGTIPIVIL